MASRTYIRSRALAYASALVGVVAVAMMGTAGSSGAASSSSTVTATVLSATTLGDGCLSAGSHGLGTITPGVPTLSPTSGGNLCSLTFGSSNDTAKLRISQHDHFGTAMVRRAGTFVAQTSRVSADLYDVAGYSSGPAGIATAVGEAGTVLTTANGGSTWTTRACAACPAVLFAVAIVPGNSAIQYIVGELGKVENSTDSGATWSAVTTGAGGSDLYDVAAVDANHVWVVGQNAEIRFWNGATWSGQTRCASLGAGETISSITAIDATHLFLQGDNGHVCSGDGSTWSNAARPFSGIEGVISATSTADVWSFPHSEDYNASYPTLTLRSADGAATWNDVGHSDTDVLRSGVAVSATTAWTVGDRGSIYRTTNSGGAWTQQDGAGGASLFSISAVDSSNAYVVGAGGAIAATTDGGAHWLRQRATTGSESLLDVASASDQVAWAVGSNGRILSTIDGGSTWIPQSSGTTEGLRRIVVLDAAHLVVVGDGGTVLHTSNGGASWSTSVTGSTARLDGVAIGSNGVGWAVGGGSTVLRTDDAGMTWHAQSMGSHGNLTGVAELSPSTAVAVSGNGEIVRTTDGGATWSTVDASANTWSAVGFASPDIGYAIGGANATAVTVNGGVTWTYHGGRNESNDLAAVSTDVAFYGDIANSAAFSFDRGVSFQSVSTNASNLAWGVDVPTDGTAWVVGENNQISRQQPAATLSDFDPGLNNWGAPGASNSLFGVCLQNVNASTTPIWAKDGNGTCTAADADPWNAVPAATSDVAETSVVGAVGSVDLVWGIRADSSQPIGTYSATVTFEVVAPNA